MTPEQIEIGRTWRAVNNAVGEVVSNTSNYPRSVQAGLLGRDISSLREKITDAVMAALGIKEES